MKFFTNFRDQNFNCSPRFFFMSVESQKWVIFASYLHDARSFIATKGWDFRQSTTQVARTHRYERHVKILNGFFVASNQSSHFLTFLKILKISQICSNFKMLLCFWNHIYTKYKKCAFMCLRKKINIFKIRCLMGCFNIYYSSAVFLEGLRWRIFLFWQNSKARRVTSR